MKKGMTAITMALTLGIVGVGGLMLQGGLVSAASIRDSYVTTVPTDLSAVNSSLNYNEDDADAETEGVVDMTAETQNGDDMIAETDEYEEVGLILPEVLEVSKPYVTYPEFTLYASTDGSEPGIEDMTFEEAGMLCVDEIQRLYDVNLKDSAAEIIYESECNYKILRSVWTCSIVYDDTTTYDVKIDAITGEIYSAEKSIGYLGEEFPMSEEVSAFMKYLDEMVMEKFDGFDYNALGQGELTLKQEMNMMHVEFFMELLEDNGFTEAAEKAIAQHGLNRGSGIVNLGCYMAGGIGSRGIILCATPLENDATLWVYIDVETMEMLRYEYYPPGAEQILDGIIIY